MKNLTVPLATVELSYNGKFVLEDGDADLLIRLNTGDVLWQKERLLNLLIDAVPDTCEYIAWLDCDVVFENRDWPAQAIKAFERYSVLHLFEKRVDLPSEATERNIPEEADDFVPILQRPSAGYQVIHGGSVEGDFLRTSGQAQTTTGLAWAASRELLQKHHLHDTCIAGGGDRLNFASAMGWFDLAAGFHQMTGPRLEHYLSWARKLYKDTQGRVGYVSGRLFHLWHGDLRDRRYLSRFSILPDNDFDPHTDIALDEQGAWKWASDKPDMHRRLREYFPKRLEDGRRVRVSSETTA